MVQIAVRANKTCHASTVEWSLIRTQLVGCNSEPDHLSPARDPIMVVAREKWPDCIIGEPVWRPGHPSPTSREVTVGPEHPSPDSLCIKRLQSPMYRY